MSGSFGQFVRGGPPDLVNITITGGNTLSGAVFCGGTPTALVIPAAAEGTAYYVQAATTQDGTFARYRVSDGASDYTITATDATQQVVSLTPATMQGLKGMWIKLEAGTAQTGDATFALKIDPLS